MQAVADELGFDFKSTVSDGLPEELEALPLFSRGHRRTMLNILDGQTNDLHVRIFDYRYTSGHGKNQSTFT